MHQGTGGRCGCGPENSARKNATVESIEEFLHEPRIAYFSMEVALRSEIPTYAGGLGILAGDTMRSAADLGLPFVGVTLVSRAGYFRQEIDEQGRQVEHPAHWDPARWARSLGAKVAIAMEDRRVWIGVWMYVVQGQTGTRQPVLLLDTDVEDNDPEDRLITHYLYGGDDAYRLKQEMVLGIGGVRLLRALGFEIRQYHMNEGHSSLLGLELLRSYSYAPEGLQPGESVYDIPRVRELCCFTTHTPVQAGRDRFGYDLVKSISAGSIGYEPDSPAGGPSVDAHPENPAQQRLVDRPLLHRLAGEDCLNMTSLALNLSEYVNGVAKRHAEVAAKMYPGFRVHAITNGVHPDTWTDEAFGGLYDRYLPGWRYEAELLGRADCCIPDAEIWQAHLMAKQRLIDAVRDRCGLALDPRLPILGFARRMTAYKRPQLLFSDTARLQAIARDQPFQIVLAGKAHPRDAEGKKLIEQLVAQARSLAGSVCIAYLSDYDMALAHLLTAGADVWLNTPLPPLEASGTSGMKAALNGVPSLSVLDGWWIEGCIEHVTGWSIGDGNGNDADADARSLYEKLEHTVLPLCSRSVEANSEWIRLMKGAISRNGAYFNSHRMMRRYAAEAYVR